MHECSNSSALAVKTECGSPKQKENVDSSSAGSLVDSSSVNDVSDVCNVGPDENCETESHNVTGTEDREVCSGCSTQREFFHSAKYLRLAVKKWRKPRKGRNLLIQDSRSKD